MKFKVMPGYKWVLALAGLFVTHAAFADYTFQKGTMSLVLTPEAIKVAGQSGWGLSLPAGSTSALDFGVAGIRQPLTNVNVTRAGVLTELQAAGSGFSVSRGGYTATFSNFDVQVQKGQVWADVVAGDVSYGHVDLFDFESYGGTSAPAISAPGTYTFVTSPLYFNTTTVAPWISNLIPDTPQDASINYSTFPVATVRSEFTVAVPEPATYAMLGLGVALLLGQSMLRRSRT